MTQSFNLLGLSLTVLIRPSFSYMSAALIVSTCSSSSLDIPACQFIGTVLNSFISSWYFYLGPVIIPCISIRRGFFLLQMQLALPIHVCVSRHIGSLWVSKEYCTDLIQLRWLLKCLIIKNYLQCTGDRVISSQCWLLYWLAFKDFPLGCLRVNKMLFWLW